MAAESTLQLLDELDKTTQDFLSELTELESRWTGPPKKKTGIVQDRIAEIVAQQTAEQGVQDIPDNVRSPVSGASPPFGEEEEEKYCMSHPRRGLCLIFAYRKCDGHSERTSAVADARVCREAFHALNFEVQEFHDLTTKMLREELERASKNDHSDCDALAVVYMSHGASKKGRERLITSDGEIDTAELWRQFALCPSLEGKPKLFFIQACRGTGIEEPVGLRVATDCSSRSQEPSPEWGLGFDTPDMLVMQSSFEGMFSFRTNNVKKIDGSVLIYYLAEILKEKGGQKDLSELLIEVTRRVAELDFTVSSKGRTLEAKQMPQTRSTLTRRIKFTAA